MSIKGNFSDISFAELLKIISKYNGRLGIWNFQEKKQYECFLQNESVVYVNINGQSVLDAETMNSFLAEISRDKQSYYCFQKDASLDSKPQINLSISKILSTTVLTNTKTNEIEQNLPNPLTKFEIAPEFPGNLPGELSLFWNLSNAHFQTGCSPADLADLLEMNIKEVRMNFYKLRMIRAIRPLRLFDVSHVSVKTKLAGANLRTSAHLEAGVKPAPAAANNLASGVLIDSKTGQLSFSMWMATQKELNNFPAAGTASFDDFELETAVSSHNQFIDKYISTNSADNFADAQLENDMEALFRLEDPANAIVSNKQPVFDSNSGTVRQSTVKRMLSSLFSRKNH